MVKVRISSHLPSLFDFINSISQTDDIQDVSVRTFGGKVELLAPGGGSSDRPDHLPGYGPITRSAAFVFTDRVSLINILIHMLLLIYEEYELNNETNFSNL